MAVFAEVRGVRERTVFPGLIGNDRLRELFRSEITGQNTAHAYILEGARGSGKHTAARTIAAAALCENRADGSHPLPCGVCASCRKVFGGRSVDVLTVRREDKATIGVEAARQVRESLWITPNDGERKFYLIEDAHRMTPQAQNALLLSLEEPPPWATFFLLCEDSTLLLETIRSRAPTLKMERFSPEFTEKWLLEQTKDADPDRIRAAARLAGGSLGLALEYFRGGDEIARYRTAADLAKHLLSGRKSDAVVFLTTLPKDRRALADVLSLTRAAVRDIVAAGKGGELIFYSPSEGIPQELRKTSPRRAMELIGALADAELDLAANLSQNTVLTALLLKA